MSLQMILFHSIHRRWYQYYYISIVLPLLKLVIYWLFFLWLFILTQIIIRLKKWGLNTYIYGPKDDYKHRSAWRDLYTKTEAGTALF